MLTTEDVRNLVDIGFMALSRGLDEPAQTIFAGVKAARPEQEAGPLGLSLVALHRGEIDEAIRILRALPPSDAALTFLGLALRRHGDLDEARTIFTEVERSVPGTPYAALAREALDEMAAGQPAVRLI